MSYKFPSNFGVFFRYWCTNFNSKIQHQILTKLNQFSFDFRSVLGFVLFNFWWVEFSNFWWFWQWTVLNFLANIWQFLNGNFSQILVIFNTWCNRVFKSQLWPIFPIFNQYFDSFLVASFTHFAGQILTILVLDVIQNQHLTGLLIGQILVILLWIGIVQFSVNQTTNFGDFRPIFSSWNGQFSGLNRHPILVISVQNLAQY